MAISLTICNLALGDLRAPPIADAGEASLEAQLCNRYYPHALARLLDDYTWSFTKRIAPLAALDTNERAVEWAYAYALPTDCSKAIRILPSTEVLLAYPFWGSPYTLPAMPPRWLDFVVENGALYTNVQDAVLEYALGSCDESVMPPLFREALRRLLAADLAMPLLNQPNLVGPLSQIAENARQDAIANDMNRQPRHDPVDEVAWARR